MSEVVMAEEKKAEGGAPSSGGSSKLGLILQIVFAVVNLGVVGGGAFLVYKNTIGYHYPQITEDELQKIEQSSMSASSEDEKPFYFTMDKFNVNLRGEPKRTIRLEVNVELLGGDGYEEIMTPDNRAKARDRLITLLAQKNYSELETLQGKLFLKDSIAKEINALMAKGVVKDIYFTDFVVQ